MRTLKQRKYALRFPATEGRTEQAHASEANINQIMARARRGELLDFANKHQPQYGECDPLTFLDAQIIIAHGNSMFEDLPATLRSRFHYDHAEFLEFIQDPENEAEAIKLKLIKPKTTITPLIDPKTQTKPQKDEVLAKAEQKQEPQSKTE